MIETFPTIYKRDSKGQVRVWYMELDENRYRTIAGIKDGQLVTSEWTRAEAKNVGRANATTPMEQARLEVESHYKKKLEGEYHRNESDIDNARWFKPMLAQTWEKRQDKLTYPCMFQPKLDGIRCIANRDGLWSRTGKPILACPHVFEELKSFFEENPDLVLDGELYNHSLRDDFNEIVSMVRKTKPSSEDLETSARMVQYHVYDMPSAEGDSFRQRYKQMYGLLSSLQINMDESIIHVVRTTLCESSEEVDENYGKALQDGYEGGIIRVDGAYEQKRSNNLIKRKDFDDDEFEIVSVHEGKGNWSGCAKKIVIRTAKGHECEATIQGSMDYCRHVLENADNYIGKQATVVFFGYTVDGALRFPIAKVLHTDKRW